MLIRVDDGDTIANFEDQYAIARVKSAGFC